MLVWGEAANLRFCAEFLAFVYHILAKTVVGLMVGNTVGHRMTWLEPQNDDGSTTTTSENGNGYHSSTTTKGLILNSYLHDIIKPAYEAVAEGMREGKLNYDDFNELFWSPTCLDLKLPLTKNKLLSVTGKTFVESRSWLMPIRAYWKVAILQVVGLHSLLVLSFCTGDGGGHWGPKPPFHCATSMRMSPIVTLAAAVLIWDLLDLGLAFRTFSRLYPTK